MTAVAFRRPFVRPTRRPTAEQRSTRRPNAEYRNGAAGCGGTPSPSCPRVVRDRGRPQRPHRLPTVSATTAPPRSQAQGAAARRRPPASRPQGQERGPLCLRRATGGSGASMRPPSPIALRSRRQRPPLQPVEQPRQLLRASRRHQKPHPVRPHGHRRTRPQMPQRRVPRLRGRLQDVEACPVARRTGSPGTVVQPSSFSYQCRTCSPGSSGRRGRGIAMDWCDAECGEEGLWSGDGWAMNGQQPEARSSYAGWPLMCEECRKAGRAGVADGARVFARSGGNRCLRHGVSVRTGKTSLVGGATRKARASHVRHRRTDGGGICLACGNIVSHHRVGADVGVRGQEAKDGVGSWNERSPLAGLSCGRTGRGASPYCLTALRSD